MTRKQRETLRRAARVAPLIRELRDLADIARVDGHEAATALELIADRLADLGR